MQPQRPAVSQWPRYTARWRREPDTDLFVAKIVELEGIATEGESIDELWFMVRNIITLATGAEEYFVDWEPDDS